VSIQIRPRRSSLNPADAADGVGDLALAGAPICGRFRSPRGGHAMNVAGPRALFANPRAYKILETTAPRSLASQAPGICRALGLSRPQADFTFAT